MDKPNFTTGQFANGGAEVLGSRDLDEFRFSNFSNLCGVM